MSNPGSIPSAQDLLRRAVTLLENSLDATSTSTARTQSETTITTSRPISQPATLTSSRPIPINAVEEHRQLFRRQSRIQPYSAGSRWHSRLQSRNTASKEKTITRTIVCLADKEANIVPSSRLKLQLQSNGLGEKRVAFPVSAKSDGVRKVLHETYPLLADCGGFELLLTKPKTRTELEVVRVGSCSTEELRCLGTGRIYVRPIQTNLILKEEDDEEEEYQECLFCSRLFLIREIRQHITTCSERITGMDTPIAVELQDEITGSSHRPIFVTEDETADGTVQHASSDDEFDDTLQEHNERELPEISEIPSSNLDSEDVPYEAHLRAALDATMSSMSDCQDPVTILKEFQENFVRGRPLDIEDETTSPEGKTSEIFVSRSNLFMDAMDEILGQDSWDFSLPLEVTFSGEMAEDYGGPRKEFLGEAMRETRDRLFEDDGFGQHFIRDDVPSLRKNHYFGAGLIFGFSLLQGGPLPNFLNEEQLNILIHESPSRPLRESELQFQSGLAKFGLIELCRSKATIVDFLKGSTSTQPMVYPKLVKLLKPIFSEQGSNKRLLEDVAYRNFLNYAKEVAAKRRGSVSLEDILKFVTGSEAEPVLGYSIKPTITFSDSMPSCLPTSNTCINRLVIAIGEKVPEDRQVLFNFFDYAFVNRYFGRA